MSIGATVGLWVVVVAVLGVVSALAYLGAFRRIDIREADEGPFTFVYQTSVTHDPAAVGRITTALSESLRAAGIGGIRPFDLYAIPGTGPNEIGFVVPDGANVAPVADANTLSRVIPRRRYMVTTFPFRGKLSFLVGYVKVDPALRAHRSLRGYAAAPAITRNDGDTITYLQPVASPRPIASKDVP